MKIFCIEELGQSCNIKFEITSPFLSEILTLHLSQESFYSLRNVIDI